MVVHVTNDNFQSEVLQADRPVLIDFYADWCGPCQALAPVLEEIASDVPYAKIAKINIDKDQALARQFQVMSIPTLIVMEHGQVVNRVTGFRSKNDIVDMLRS